MNKTKMLDTLNMVDDNIIEAAIEVDSPKKFKEISMQQNIKTGKNTHIIKLIGSIAACICLVLVAVMSVNSLTGSKNQNLVELTSPITEVNSATEMKDYLGFDVPVIDGKDVDSCLVIGDDGDKYAYHARICYTDGSSFEMEKAANTDVSGIYGATLKESVTINGETVDIYTLDDIAYSTWSDGTYSYSYSSSSIDNVKAGTSAVISAAK